MARPHIEPYLELDSPWKKMTLPGFPKGMRYKVLSLDADTGACSLKVRYEPGYRLPGGMSRSEMELFVLSGALVVGDRVHGAGSYFSVPAGVVLPALSSPRGAEVLQYYNGGEPSFVASDSDHPDAERDRLATVDAYEGLAWATAAAVMPATAPGCLVKLLRADPHTGAATFLYCLVPNFRQDAIVYHDCCEESYHVWGTTWTLQAGDVPTGGYVWRPPYVNHGPCASRLGTLALGRSDGPLQHHVHFNPWTTPAQNRAEAADRLARQAPALYAWVAGGEHRPPLDGTAAPGRRAGRAGRAGQRGGRSRR